MIKYYADSEEKFLKGVEVFYNSSDGILYKNYDSTATTPYTDAVEKKELINLFDKGLLIVNNGSGYVRPTLLTVSTNYSYVSYITVGASDIAVLTSFYSKGYTAG